MTRYYTLLTALSLLTMPLAGGMENPAQSAPNVTAFTGQATPGGVVSGGRLIRMTTPLYPSGARHAQVGGVVTIEAWIGKDGRVVDTCVLGGPNMLRRPARDAVKRWRYEPTLVNGKPIDRVSRIDVYFPPPVY